MMEIVNFVMIIILTCAVVYLLVAFRYVIKYLIAVWKCVKILSALSTDGPMVADDLEELRNELKEVGKL